MDSRIESKVSEVVKRNTLIYETENHVFKLSNVELTDSGMIAKRARGVIQHKNGDSCGDFAIHTQGRKIISLNLNLDCRDLLVDLADFLRQLDSGLVTEVETFSYEAAEDVPSIVEE